MALIRLACNHMSLSLVLSTQATPIYVDPSSQAPFPPGIPVEILQSIEDPAGLVQVGRKNQCRRHVKDKLGWCSALD